MLTIGVPIVAQQKRIQPVSMRMWVQSLASFSGLRIQCYCELWFKSQTHGSDPMLPQLWHRPIRLLALELPYSAGMAVKRKKVLLALMINN